MARASNCLGFGPSKTRPVVVCIDSEISTKKWTKRTNRQTASNPFLLTSQTGYIIKFLHVERNVEDRANKDRLKKNQNRTDVLKARNRRFDYRVDELQVDDFHWLPVECFETGDVGDERSALP